MHPRERIALTLLGLARWVAAPLVTREFTDLPYSVDLKFEALRRQRQQAEVRATVAEAREADARRAASKAEASLRVAQCGSLSFDEVMRLRVQVAELYQDVTRMRKGES